MIYVNIALFVANLILTCIIVFHTKLIQGETQTWLEIEKRVLNRKRNLNEQSK